MRALWLPDVLRGAGLRVSLVPGWESRGREMTAVAGVVCHHTAGPATGNAPSLGIVTRGRSDLPGPLSQLVLGRDGTFYVVASGRANHAGRGEWRGVTDGNGRMLGIEAEATGRDTWYSVQYGPYVAGVAAILRHLRLSSAMACGHKEYARPLGRKPDPNFDMDVFRTGVERILNPPLPPTPPPLPEDDMFTDADRQLIRDLAGRTADLTGRTARLEQFAPRIVKVKGRNEMYLIGDGGSSRRWLQDGVRLQNLAASYPFSPVVEWNAADVYAIPLVGDESPDVLKMQAPGGDL